MASLRGLRWEPSKAPWRDPVYKDRAPFKRGVKFRAYLDTKEPTLLGTCKELNT